MPAYRNAAAALADGDKDLARRMLSAAGGDDAAGTVAPGSLLAGGTIGEIADAWRPFLRPQGIDDLTGRLVEVFAREMERHCTSVANLAALFRRLKARGFVLGVVTNDGERGAHRTLATMDIASHLDFVAGFDSGHGEKSGPNWCRCRTMSSITSARSRRYLTTRRLRIRPRRPHSAALDRSAGTAKYLGVKGNDRISGR